MTDTPAPSPAKRYTVPYKRWNAMMGRCYSKGNGKGPYKYYGARGITVSSEWHTFDGFWKDMKDSYFEGASLDRIDNEQGYSKSNCRWVTAEAQRRHKRGVLLYRYRGQMLTLEELSKETGIKRDTLYSRIRIYGWSLRQAVSTAPDYANTRI